MPFAATTHAIHSVQDSTSVSWGYFVLTVICACMLAAGFFLAARQHFNTMEYGMKNSKLREQVENLRTEKRRLILAREMSLSPSEIKRAARSLGFREAGETVLASAKAPQLSTVQTTLMKPTVKSIPSDSTTGSKPVKAFYPESTPKPSATDKTVKRIVIQQPRKEAIDTRLIASMR